ncbi:hypothetical protein NOF04DRAFT_1277964 [Fusarium oxysporum II5]|nr:hypothetical protein NOF04DRAFT_1277964 [Fusarium oxysporum II5]
MSASPEPFTLFHKFPPELKLEILNFCSRNDLVCLSLTGPDMRNLVTPLIPSKPNLTWVDQLGPTPDVPSECRDPYHNNIPRRSDCDGAREQQVIYFPTGHRFRRHEYRGCKVCYRCRMYPTDHPALTGGKRCEKHQTIIGVVAKDYPTEIDGGENGVHMGLTTRHTSPKTPEDETQESFNRVISSEILFYSLDVYQDARRDATWAHGVASTIERRARDVRHSQGRIMAPGGSNWTVTVL